MLLALSALISCTSIEEQTPDTSFNEIIVGMFPSLPTLPSFPELGWEYENERYSISEEDVDKLLDYGENKIPLYRYEIEVYSREMEVLKETLKKKF